jgi:hypothetical protein
MKRFKASLRAWATELGCDLTTLQKRMRAAGAEPKPGKQWTAREVFKAWTGDLVAARAREALANAELKEQRLAERRGAVIPREDVVRYITETHAPARELVISMPGLLAGRVNHADPHHAQAILSEWSDMFLKHVRESLPPPPKAEDE